MNKTPLLTGTSHRAYPTSGSRLLSPYGGQPMKGPDGEHQGSTQDGGGNNGGGNSGGGTDDSQSENNGGQALDLTQFWSSEDESSENSSHGESAGNPGGSSSNGTQEQAPKPMAQTVAEAIQAADFGALITPEIQEGMSDGDPKLFNEGMRAYGQAVMRQTLQQSVGIMRELHTKIMADVDSKLNTRITDDKNYDALVAAIPSAGKKEMGPTIRNVYDKALTRTKGDSKAAIDMTKEVLRLQAETFGGDLGLDVAPRSPGDNYEPPKTTNWLEELSGR